MAGSLIFEFQLELPEPEEAAAPPGHPMRILVMGDFSGQCARGPLAQRQARQVDLDSLDQAIAHYAPTLRLSLDGADTSLRFAALDDFHPDQLYRQAQAFHALHGQRQRLKCPASFAAAAAQMSAIPPAQKDFDALVRTLVGGVPGDDPRQSAYLAAADTVIAAKMRALLHHPAFQQLEAAWRGVHWLITSLELGGDLQLHIIDVGRAELAADLQAAGAQWQTSAVHQLLVDQARRAPDVHPWSVLVGDYSFDAGAADVALLASLAAVAEAAGAPFLAGAQPGVLGCPGLAGAPDPAAWKPPEADMAARWQGLRASAHAGWLGLALPRVLLRLPYGTATDPIEQFAFEEAGLPPVHAHYLWGNPAFGLALLLGRAFQGGGWAMVPDTELELDGLPAHNYRQDGEARMQACAEAYLSERAGLAMLALGVMPLLSMQNRNGARLARWQSLALPSRALSGAWQNSLTNPSLPSA